MKKSLQVLLFVVASFLCATFESNAQLATVSQSFDATAFAPTGWVLSPTPGVSPAVWSRRTAGANPLGFITPHSGLGMASFRSSPGGGFPGAAVGDSQLLITPVFDLTSRGAATASVSFWMFRDSLSAANLDSVAVYIGTAATTTGASLIGTVVRNNSVAMPQTEPHSGWYMYTFAYPASFTGATNYLIFKGTTTLGQRMYIDDVVYDTYPVSCSGTPNVGNIINGLNLICNGGGATTLSLQSPLVGQGGVIYSWQSASSSSGPWNNIGTGADTLHTANLTATTYFQCVVSCLSSGLNYTTPLDSILVNSNANPTVTINGTNSFCAGLSTLLYATGATTYSWSPSTGLTSAGGADMDSMTAAPAANTLYTITGFDAIGCSSTATVNVTVNPKPALNATAYPLTGNTPLPQPSICNGDTIRLNAIPGGGGNPWTYVWSTSKTTRIDTVAPTTTTTYIVTATVTATGCTASDTIVITVSTGTPPTVTITPAGPLTVCNGNAVTIVASGATNYVWSPANGLNTTTNDTVLAAPFGPTLYTVSATNPGSCPGTATVQVNAGNSPVATAIVFSGNDTVCSGATIILRGGPGGGGPGGLNTFSWSNGPVTRNDTIMPTTSGTYVVTVTSPVGCSDTASVAITVTAGTAPTLTISPTGPLASCDGNPVQITASGTGTSYNWTPAAGLDTTLGPVVNATPPGPGPTNYVVTSTLGSCTSSVTVTVGVGTSPVLNVTPYDFHTNTALNDTLCANIGDTIRLNAIPGGGFNPWTYLWNNGHTVRIDTVVIAAASTTYTVTATSNQGCVGHDTIVMTIIPDPVANFFYTHNAASYVFTDLSTGATSWNWSFGDGSSNSLQNPTYTYSTFDTFTVTLIITSPCGSDTTTQQIIVDSTNNIGINPVTTHNIPLKLYPNPATEEVMLSFNLNDATANYTVLNAVGQEVANGKLTAVSNNHYSKNISLKGMAAGTYTIKVTSASQTATAKLLKQ